MVTSFQPFGSTSSQALGINNLGDIVGDYFDAGGAMHGYLDVGGAFTSFDPTGSTATTANGINDNGQIVGFFVDANDNTVGFLANVPEPATLVVFASGLAGLALVRRRKSRAAVRPEQVAGTPRRRLLRRRPLRRPDRR